MFTKNLKLINTNLILMLALLHQLNSSFYFNHYDNTTNTTNLSTYLANNQSACNTAPFTTLNLCNNTCVTCLPSDSNKCARCEQGYYLEGTSCLLDQTNYNYTHLTYIGLTLSEAKTSIANFRHTSTNDTLTVNRVVSICQTSSFEMEIAGVFGLNDGVNLQFYRTDPIDQIQIKLNFVSLVSSIAFFITLNDNPLYSKHFPSMSDLNGVYVQNSNTSSQSYLTLDALSYNSASSIFLPIDTNLINYITHQYTIKFYVQSNSSQKYIWGFNDVVILQRDCQTCVTKAVMQLMHSTSLSVAYTFLIVVVLIIILCLAMVYEQAQSKKEFQEKLGASTGNLPIKAMDRVIDDVRKARKVREKEMNNEARDYNNMMKKKEKQEKQINQVELDQRSFVLGASKVDSLSKKQNQ